MPHGADFTTDGPGIGNPLACVDNNFHGTHVAGIIAARRNGIGVVGVAPNVTLVPIKVCDANGNCYVSDVVQGLTYAGDLKLNVINMSFFVDDDSLGSRPSSSARATRLSGHTSTRSNARCKYARSQGVSLISAIGNSDQNLANPPGGKGCKTVPAMSPGVSATVALGQNSEKVVLLQLGQRVCRRVGPRRQRSGRRRLRERDPLDDSRRLGRASRARRWPRRTRLAWPH